MVQIVGNAFNLVVARRGLWDSLRDEVLMGEAIYRVALGARLEVESLHETTLIEIPRIGI